MSKQARPVLFPANQPRSFLLWDGYGVLPSMCGTQKKPPAAATAGSGDEAAALATIPSGRQQQQQPQRSAVLCSLPAKVVVDMVHEC